MKMISDPNNAAEPTPVDDVRRIRERLSREAGGDVYKLAEASQKVFEQYRRQLGLKLVTERPVHHAHSDAK
jgi:hypothetical protein